jgi:hypothetical protein
MADKYLKNDNGRKREVEAKTTSSGAGDAGKIVALNVRGKLDKSMFDEVQQKVLVAGEALSSGNLVYVYDDAGTVKVKKAVADSVGHEADGFVLSSAALDENVLVFFEGTLASTGLTAGERYYLSAATAGGVVTSGALPTGSGEVIQFIGKAISTTEINFEPDEGIILA